MTDFKAEAERRYARLREEMQARGVEVLALYSAPWKTEIVHYVSNYRAFGLCACALLPLNGEPILFVSGEEELARAQDSAAIADVRAIDGLDLRPAAAAARALGRTLAIAGLETLNRAQYAAFAALFGEDGISSGWPILDKAALIKSPAELEIIRACAKIADIGELAMVDAARVGVRAHELAAEIDAAMLAAGAEDNFQMTSTGKLLSCLHIPGEAALEPGDLVLAEITPFRGSITYAAQRCTTVKLGRASSAERRCYDMLIEALDGALERVKPGAKAREIAQIQNEIIGRYGYEKYCNPPFMRSRGHNLGLGTIELTVDNELELQPGMCMVVHPNQFTPETGYLACGTYVLVTETGCERLSALPTKLYEVEVDI